MITAQQYRYFDKMILDTIFDMSLPKCFVFLLLLWSDKSKNYDVVRNSNLERSNDKTESKPSGLATAHIKLKIPFL